MGIFRTFGSTSLSVTAMLKNVDCFRVKAHTFTMWARPLLGEGNLTNLQGQVEDSTSQFFVTSSQTSPSGHFLLSTFFPATHEAYT